MIKNQILEKFQISKDSIYLHFKGKSLRNENTVSQERITAYCTLTYSTKLYGGMQPSQAR